MKALIRADASVQIGMGHKVRCQALKAAFTDLGWHCQFVVKREYQAFAEPESRLIDEEDEFHLLAKEADLVILDHYHYQACDIANLYHCQNNLLVIDDMNERGPFPCKWLLNPLQENYSDQVETPLLGPKYALLRPIFSTPAPFISSKNKLLVTLGGTDPLELTLPILKALLQVGFDEDAIQVLLGANASNGEQVITFCKQHHIAYEQGVEDVAELMHHAKMAISAAGGTLFELACLGVPAVFAQVAENQTRSLEQHLPLAWCDMVRFDQVTGESDKQAQLMLLANKVINYWQDDAWLQSSRRITQELVDGLGAKRAALQIHNQIKGSDQTLV
ncbi:UDP-2,4-diacetamido-2,4,6-trideoxy-beta-L-altropyranose hydrolase [Marinomonas epiphytica]